MNRELAEPIVRAENFEARIAVANDHFEGLIEQRDPELKRYAAFFEIMNEFESGNVTDFVVKDYSAERFLTSKTMLRYFNHCVDISPKKAACMIRMRKALTSYFGHPGDFTVHQYGYYDYSHFCREVVALTGYTPGMLRNSR